MLQEQSTLPVKNAARMHENVRLFDGVIKAAGAKTVLYMTWARLNAPDSQQAITDAYTAIGKELGATVAPVGVAWQRFLRDNDRPVLHDRDQSHPTVAGSYLAACVFLAALFGECPVGVDVDVPGLSAEDRAAFQAAAWQAWESPMEGGTRNFGAQMNQRPDPKRELVMIKGVWDRRSQRRRTEQVAVVV